MEYCHNETITIEWSNGAFSTCFLDTLSSAFLGGYMLVYGSVKLFRLRKTPLRSRLATPKHLFHAIHLLAVALIAVCYPILITVHAALDSSRVYGSAVMSTVLHSFAWTLAFLVARHERARLVPHGKTLLVFYGMVLIEINMDLASINGENAFFRLRDGYHVSSFALFICRYVIGTLLPAFALLDNRELSKALELSYVAVNGDDELAAAGSAADKSAGKSKPSDKSKSGGGNDDDDMFSKNDLQNLWRRMKLLWPFLWPKGDRKLQFYVVFCLVLLAAGRGINVLVPSYNKKIVDDMTPSINNGTIIPPYKDIGIYILLIFTQGGNVGSTGFLNAVRSNLWVKITQFTDRAIRLKMFTHIHNLSLRWHLSRKTGEILRVMDRGTDSIDTLLSAILFNILPTFVDIGIAIGYFIYIFNVWFGVIVFVAMALYIGFTVAITEWRTKFRKKMNKMDNESRAKAVDSLLNFETVKYYEAEKVEAERYEAAIIAYQAEEWRSNFTLSLLNMGQTLIITSGLAAGSMYCGYKVVLGELSVGDFVLFLSYVVQLYSPLNMFGTWYRMLSQYFIDMENMFDLLAVEPEVKDVPDASDLAVPQGEVKFENVSFAYEPSKPVLKNVSFTIPPGETFALVGSSGGGKSTIVRLLFRFYDVTEGKIFIDGQDISKVKQDSLRRKIGVVPQDTVLFHDTIKYNIHYGRLDATDSEVIEAARAAEMHDKIMQFPDKYETLVGERGLRLSGGEKQRVAIARTILKAPQIVMLDEATSALDTLVERQIQASLSRVCNNRTTLVVAHRLSTIIHSNQILVMKDGGITERGTHAELLEMKGLYHQMWTQQLEAASKSVSAKGAEPAAPAPSAGDSGSGTNG